MSHSDDDEPELLALAPRHEVTRRDALKLLAGGIAVLSAGCIAAAGEDEIVPYVVDPPELRPGVTVRYTSALVLDGFGTGVIVETHEGRPTKLDGNPAHPANLGGSTPWMQARILDLYDPWRLAQPRIDDGPTSWSELVQRLAALPPGPVWLVMPPQSSRALAGLLDRLRARREVHVVYDAPLDHRAAYRGSELVYGRPLEQQLDLSRAGVLVALDADVLAGMPMSAAWSRAAAARRNPDRRMSRIWACEPMLTPTGMLADERIVVPAGDTAAVAVAVLDELRARGLAAPALPAALVSRARARLGATVDRARALADDLAGHRGAGAVVAGDRQPPIVHALARWIDHACGNDAGPVSFTAPALLEPLGGASLADLAAACRAKSAAAVIVVDANPVYTAPPALGLAEALAAVPFSLYAGLHPNQTGAACRAQMPLAHELETWTDPRAWDGTLAIGQPTIRPRFEVVSTLEVIGALAGSGDDPRTLVRAQLRDRVAPGRMLADVEGPWASALRTGVVPGTREPAVQATPRGHADLAAALAPLLDAPVLPGVAVEIALAPSPQVHDGRFAPNAWLQELPHPVTKQVWGNAALMSRATAALLGVDDGDRVQVATAAGTLELPAFALDEHCDGAITVELGHGQRRPEIPIADRVGGDAYALRDAAGGMILRGTITRGLGPSIRVVRTQLFTEEHGRDMVPHTTLADFTTRPDFTARARGDQPSLLPPRSREGVQWGMSIDTSICTGCSSCMVACQAENNIPTVGPDDVARGRHMNWIRVDRYTPEPGIVVNEPMPCQHCEDAPCEYVCPVMATTHSADGLNEQVYNRCIGTRFCSNNCPYKVRRFNWFAYEKHDSRALQYNPDVTVRSRGVMEKCTYCVQRIRGAEHEALVARRELRAGDVVTACQAACPTGAIQFGLLHETGTTFAAMRQDPRRFEALHELGTRPRTQYLAKIRNPKDGR